MYRDKIGIIDWNIPLNRNNACNKLVMQNVHIQIRKHNYIVCFDIIFKFKE